MRERIVYKKLVFSLLFLLLVFSPNRVYAYTSHSLKNEGILVPSLAVALENGTATTTEISINGTIANVTATALIGTQDYVDNNISDVDSSDDKGSHSNFSAQQYSPDSEYDTLTEEAVNWWNSDYSSRRNVNVTTGSNTPYKGFAGYTVQFTVNTTALVTAGKMQSNGDDLRIVYYNGSSYEELDKHIIDMNESSTKVRFQLQANVSASSFDDNYYMYYNNSVVGAGPANYSNVYLWYDDASSDRESEYTQGRVDSTAHGGSWGDTIAWDSSGNYTFDTGDNFADSLRPTGLNERDVYIEYEEYQTGAYATDMTSGPLVRWVGTGSGGTEDSSHWYCYEISDSAYETGSYASHDDITADDRGSVVVSNGTLSTFPQQSWTRMALASWDTNPTNLKVWYYASPTESESGSFGISGRFNGTHDSASDNEDAGEVGIWLQQDAGRVRNIIIRRYVEPEPTTSLGEEESINYELDLEVQWISTDYDEDYEYVCIYTGTLAAEDLKVDVRTGSSWTTVISTLQSNQWNNVSVSSYFTGSTFTIRFKGSNESSDVNKDSWYIDATLLHVWTNGSTYDYVLSAVSQKNYHQNISLNIYDSTNIERLANCTVWFHDSTTSVQVEIIDGSIISSTGAWYNLTAFGESRIALYAEESISGTSILYIKLEAVKGNSIIYENLIKMIIN